MQLTGVPQVVAPLATGHPLGLPGAPVRTAEETKVQPVKEQSTTDTDHAADHGSDNQPPAGFWRSLTGLPDPANHVAPPSIMQIRISALLEEQAEALLQELRDKAIARLAAAPAAQTQAQSQPNMLETSAPLPPAAGVIGQQTEAPEAETSRRGARSELALGPLPEAPAEGWAEGWDSGTQGGDRVSHTGRAKAVSESALPRSLTAYEPQSAKPASTSETGRRETEPAADIDTWARAGNAHEVAAHYTEGSDRADSPAPALASRPAERVQNVPLPPAEASTDSRGR